MASSKNYSTRGTRYCSAIGCSNAKGKKHNLSFFCLPKEEKRCKLWISNSGRQDLVNKNIEYLHKNYVFCSDHFEVDQCMNKKKDRLVWNAVPTLFGNSKQFPSSKRLARGIPTSVLASSRADEKDEDGNSYKRCLYVYCRNNSRVMNKHYMQGVFFLPLPSAESNLVKRKLWLKLCGRLDLSKDRSTDKKMFYVCSTHFESGNGPTKEHPDPIQHRVTLKTSSRNRNVKFISLKGNPAPQCLQQTNENTEESESGSTIPASTLLLPSATNSIQTTLNRKSAISRPVDDVSLTSNPSVIERSSPENAVRHSEISEHVDHMYSVVKQTELRLPTGDPAEQYEITVLQSIPNQLFTISDIRAKYPIPLYWTMCLTNESVFFAKISKVTQCVLVRLTINRDMTTELQALCRDLNQDHPILQTFPKSITDFAVLDRCFSLLRLWNPCQGNNEKAYVSLFMQSQNLNGFYSAQMESVHSVQCSLLTDERGARCKMCKLLRNSLSSLFRRFVKNHKQLWNENEIIENNENEDDNTEDILVLKNSQDATYSVTK